MTQRELTIVTVDDVSHIAKSLQMMGDTVQMHISPEYIGISREYNLCLIYALKDKEALADFLNDPNITKYIIHPLAEYESLLHPLKLQGFMNIYDYILADKQRIYVRDLKRKIYFIGRENLLGEEYLAAILNAISSIRQNLIFHPKKEDAQEFNHKRDYYARLLNHFTVTLAERGPMLFRRLVSSYNGPIHKDKPIYVLNYFIRSKSFIQDPKTSLVYIPEQYR